jgi:hypothetical protein
MFAEAQRKGLLYFGDDEKTKQEFLNWLFRISKKQNMLKKLKKYCKFVNDLIESKIEVRAHNSKSLHAKFYLFLPEKHSEHSDGWVIMGSSI